MTVFHYLFRVNLSGLFVYRTQHVHRSITVSTSYDFRLKVFLITKVFWRAEINFQTHAVFL